MGFREIVVGLDRTPGSGELTKGSRLALEQARWLAERGGSRITLVHSTATDEHWDPDAERFETAAHPPQEPDAALCEALESLKSAGLEAELVQSAEKAWLAILHHALARKSDLVVVGKRSSSFLQGPLLGSVAMKLLRKCPCPVWVVKPKGVPAPRCVVAATDLTPLGERVLSLATQVAREAGAALHVVHSFQLTMEAQLGRDEDRRAFVERESTRAREVLARQLAACKAPDGSAVHVELSSPSQLVLASCRHFDADLVVLGTLSRTGVAGLLVGNTAERLLARLDVSLLALKPEDFVSPIAPGGSEHRS
jgi:universal stress protein E